MHEPVVRPGSCDYHQTPMEELIEGLIAKVGLDKDKAEKVVSFLKENASKVPEWLASSGALGKLPGGLGDKLGGMLGGD